MTVTFRAPIVAAASIVNVAVMVEFPVPLTTITELTGTPLPLTFTVAPPAKKPVMLTATAVPWTPAAGVIDANTGGGGLIVNVTAVVVPPGVVTVTFRAPNAAIVSVKFAAAIVNGSRTAV